MQFDIWQRGNIVSVQPNQWTYGPDGWIGLWGNSGGQMNIVACPPQAFPTPANMIELVGASGNSYVWLNQRLESSATGDMGAQVCTFQARFFNGTPYNFQPLFYLFRPNNVDYYGNGTTYVNSMSMQMCNSNTWNLIAIAMRVDGNAAKFGLQAGIYIPNALVDTTHACYMTAVDFRVTTGVPEGINNTPPPPELRPIEVEQAIANRYYQTGRFNILRYAKDGNDFMSHPMTFVGSMRATPTMTFTPVYNNGCTTFQVVPYTPNDFYIYEEPDSSGGSSTFPKVIQWQANWFASAEL